MKLANPKKKGRVLSPEGQLAETITAQPDVGLSIK
jgi:hypothetical protein